LQRGLHHADVVADVEPPGGLQAGENAHGAAKVRGAQVKSTTGISPGKHVLRGRKNAKTDTKIIL
jgi:hypothetical protein